MAASKRVLLIISGGIAAYKCLELIRRLTDADIAVRCIMTKAAERFVTPLSVGALSRDTVYSDLFSLKDESEMGHIRLSRAADLVFTSRSVDAQEALRIGLLDRLFEAETVVDEAVALAEEIAFWPPMAVRSAKRVIQHNLNVGLEEALRYETLGLNFAGRAPHDVQESRLSFSEQRPPTFTGE